MRARRVLHPGAHVQASVADAGLFVAVVAATVRVITAEDAVVVGFDASAVAVARAKERAAFVVSRARIVVLRARGRRALTTDACVLTTPCSAGAAIVRVRIQVSAHRAAVDVSADAVHGGVAVVSSVTAERSAHVIANRRHVAARHRVARLRVERIDARACARACKVDARDVGAFELALFERRALIDRIAVFGFDEVQRRARRARVQTAARRGRELIAEIRRRRWSVRACANTSCDGNEFESFHFARRYTRSRHSVIASHLRVGYRWPARRSHSSCRRRSKPGARPFTRE